MLGSDGDGASSAATGPEPHVPPGMEAEPGGVLRRRAAAIRRTDPRALARSLVDVKAGMAGGTHSWLQPYHERQAVYPDVRQADLASGGRERKRGGL